MGWFEKINLTAPSQEELNRPELNELERELTKERQKASELLAGVYDEASELGIDLDNGYEKADNESYQTIKQNLLERRAQIAMLLEEVEAEIDKVGRMGGPSREVEA